MSDAMYKMLGIFLVILSIFVLLGAMFLSAPLVPGFVTPLCWFVGLALLTAGIVFYKVMKKET